MTASRIGLVQMRSGLDRAENIAAATRLIEEAAAGGAALIATPEMTNIVEKNPKNLMAQIAPEQDNEDVAAFGDLAARLERWLLIGSLAIKVAERRAVNRSYLFAPDGRIAATYDKIHMFDVDLAGGESYRESSVYDAGEAAVVLDTPFARLGLTICYDVRFPHLYRQLAQTGANVIAVPAAFTKQTGEAHWHVLLRARAIETGSFVIAPAQGGLHQDGRETYGHSLVIDPWGGVIAARTDDAPGVLFADIDVAKSAQARARIPNLALERIFKVDQS